MSKNTLDKKVYAIWSPKGGVGKTFIAAHLAKMSAQRGYLTGVIDFNRQSPSTTAALDIALPREKSLREALFCENDNEVISNFHNNEKKEKFLFCTGLNINNRVDDLYEVTDLQIVRLLEIARNKFNILFLDLPSSYFELTSYESLKVADRIVIVIDNDYNSIVALQGYLRFLNEVNISKSNFYLVVNKNMGLISEEEIEKLCGISVSATIPFYRHLVKDMNEGKTVFENGGGFKDRLIANNILRIFELLITDDDEDRKEKKYKRFISLFHGFLNKGKALRVESNE